jgi:nitrate reductase NapE
MRWTKVQYQGRAGLSDTPLRMSAPEEKTEQYTRSQELRSFLFLTVVMAPALAGIIIAGYGFLVWAYQVLAGPPTGG